MAFTDSEKASIRRYLGFPDVFRYANPRLEGALDVVGSRPEAAALARTYLVELDAIMARVSGTESLSVLSMAGIKKVDGENGVEFFGSASGQAVLKDVRRIGSLWVAQLSTLFGIPAVSDPFTGGGYAGDGWSSRGFQINLG